MGNDDGGNRSSEDFQDQDCKEKKEETEDPPRGQSSAVAVHEEDVKLVGGGGANPAQLLKIVSWNINGMKTLNMQDVLRQLDCSILAVQETKLTRKQLDQSQVIPPGYSSYFSFSSNRIGYSGVATFCNGDWTSVKAEEGLCMPMLRRDNVGGYPGLSEEEEGHMKYANADGRTVIIQNLVMLPDGTQRPLTIFNVYCPRLRDDPEDGTNNSEFKKAFHRILHRRAKLLVEQGSFVMIAGDINISHRWIDHCDGDPKNFVTTSFRQLLNDLLSNGFVDSFRLLHPDQESAFTCWNTRLNARENNYGTRIDYIFVDKELSFHLEKAEIHPDVFGSDHCPISVTFHSLRSVPSESPPQFATKYYPEFKGKQKNMKEFLLDSTKLVSSGEALPSKKRPLDDDPGGNGSGKVQAAKRVQLSLRSFFSKNSKESESSKLPTPELTQELPSYTPESTQEIKSQPKPMNNSSTAAWKSLMKAPDVPLCKGHQEPCTRRTVKKKGANFGREFYSCSHGVGKSDDPNANCNFFQWVKAPSSK